MVNHPHSSSKRNQESSPFFRLPAELRNQIYEHVFPGHDILPLWDPHRHTMFFVYHKPYITDDSPPDHMWIKEAHTTSLLRVCRQIRFDASLLPFSLNTFHVTDFDTWKRFTDSLSENQRGAIAKVEMAYCLLSTIRVFPNGGAGLWGPLKALGGLEEIKVVKASRIEEVRVIQNLESWSAAATAFCGHEGVRIVFVRSRGERRHEVWMGNEDPPVG
jgi:hypothetical protein